MSGSATFEVSRVWAHVGPVILIRPFIQNLWTLISLQALDLETLVYFSRGAPGPKHTDDVYKP